MIFYRNFSRLLANFTNRWNIVAVVIFHKASNQN